MRIGVLDFTLQDGPEFDGIPTVGEILIEWLSPAFPEAEMVVVPIAYGAAFPGAAEFDGVLLSGSEYGVYDDVPWMAPLKAWVGAVRAAERPIFGICFGHQVMAEVFGGRAEKAACGNQVGVRRYEIGGRAFDANAWHGDQVIAVPPGATVTGTADYCPVAALDYDFPAMSVQFHPEYTEERLHEIWEVLEDRLDRDEIAGARASMAGARVDRALMAREAAEFFRRYHRTGR